MLKVKTNEVFFTPIHVTHNLLDYIDFNGVRSVLDPCAGSGNIAKALRQYGYYHDITMIERDPILMEKIGDDQYNRTIILDDYFQVHKCGLLWKHDLVIMNPPYSHYEAFVKRALVYHTKDDGKVCVLLKLQHLTGTKRYKFIYSYTPSMVLLLSARPRITGGVGDIGGYAWVIWDKPLINSQQTKMVWVPPQKYKINGKQS